MSGKVIRLADFARQLPIVELRSGREVTVREFDRTVLELRDKYLETEDPRIYWEIAALLLPDATEEEISRLSIFEVSAIIQIASGETPEGGPSSVGEAMANIQSPPSPPARARRSRAAAPKLVG
ncbi:MAG: hypothetical protein M3O61_03355 [Gemmatimonadota bacterium]|nr:hypothetical protein [Gemmatimonadota bacterium]